MLQSKGSQRVGHDWVTGLNWIITLPTQNLKLKDVLVFCLCLIENKFKLAKAAMWWSCKCLESEGTWWGQNTLRRKWGPGEFRVSWGVFSGFFPLEGPGWDALLPLALPVWVWDESLEMRQCLLEWLSQPRKTVHGRPLLLPLELKIKSPLSTSNAGLMVRTTSEGA